VQRSTMHLSLASVVLLLSVAACSAQQNASAGAAAAPCRERPFSAVQWAQMDKYKAANEQAGLPKEGEKRVVFFGSSTTENWGSKYGSVFFPGKPYLNRGVSGETTAQMLLRFEQDVVALHPAVVVILAGSNDVAGNTGPTTLPEIEDNLRAMAVLATAAGIHVVLASQQPTTDFPWNHGMHPAADLLALSEWEKSYAQEQGLVYVDYYVALVGPDGSYKPGLSVDGVHPTAEGYRIMAPLAEQAIAAALARAPDARNK
jgi:acyl-CoA thioesterase-1